MIMMMFGFFLITVLLIVGFVTLQPWQSSQHIVNACWLNDSEKFALIARWGIFD